MRNSVQGSPGRRNCSCTESPPAGISSPATRPLNTTGRPPTTATGEEARSRMPLRTASRADSLAARVLVRVPAKSGEHLAARAGREVDREAPVRRR